MSETHALRLNPLLRMLPFDGDGPDKCLLELDDARGRTLRIVVSALVRDALFLLLEPQPIAQMLDGMRAKGLSAEAAARLHATLLQCVERRVLVPDDCTELLAVQQPHKPAYMSAMLKLVPAAMVNVLVPPLTVLFSRPGLVLGGLLALLGQYLLLGALAQPRIFFPMNSWDILGAIGLTLVVLLIHELGHAAAAFRAGARKVSIGVGWYVCFPVAYADLSETWRFSARQRALIDVAGVYLQSLAVLGLILLYRQGGSAILLTAATAGSLSILWNLNPLLRLDGYWLLSDLLRTSNLRADAAAALRLQWNRIAPAAWQVAAASSLRISTRAATGLALYALVCTVFFAVLVVVASWRFAGGLITTIPAYVQQLVAAPFAQLSVADLIVLVGGAIWKLVLMYFLGRYLLKLLLRGSRQVLTWVSMRGGKQPMGRGT